MDNVIPATLGDVMNKDLSGFQQIQVYYLELEHGLMGFFPALISETGEIVVCLNKELLEKVKKLLPRRRCKQGQLQILANTEGCYGFEVGNPSGDKTKPLHILTEKEFTQRSSEERPFKWAPGLVSNDMDADEFKETLDLAAEKIRDSAVQ